MNNVQKPDAFLAKLSAANRALYELFELCRETELAPVREDGCRLYDEESGKTCFQVAGQYARPGEFLAALLDMIRVTYEPHFVGTFFLNANPGFIYQSVPETPFTLGYLSEVGEPGESFSNLWNGRVAASLLGNGYDMKDASATFIVVAAASKRMEMAMLDEVFEVTRTGFSVDEALQLLGSELSPKPVKEAHTGFVWDDGLDTRLRVSIWMFIESPRNLRVVR